MNYIKRDNAIWEYVIGLEVHAQMNLVTKLFSNSIVNYNAAPNSNVSPFDIASPGILPVLNEGATEKAVKSCIALNLKVNTYSVFDRKHYFYPDLPAGYQISQFYYPIGQNGYLDIKDNDGNTKKIRINRLHIEQDAGKSMHDQMADLSFIDFNRAGVALMEIVTEPDISSPDEAAQYVKKLRTVLRYVDTCTGDMQNGCMRVDANVSVRKKGEKVLGTRCEIKNLNSIKFLMDSIEYEALRQIKLLENGQIVEQETRLFDVAAGVTRTMRSKSDAVDYRYFPDPDLLPLTLDQSYIDNIKKSMVELPDEKAKRYQTEFSLSDYDIEVLTSEREISEYFEAAAQSVKNKKLLSNWLIVELFGYLNKAKLSISESNITPNHLASLVNCIDQQIISGKMAKTVFEQMCSTSLDANAIIEELGLSQISNPEEITNIIVTVLSANPEKVAEYKGGATKLFGYFIGQIMKISDGRANPELANQILQDKLNK